MRFNFKAWQAHDARRRRSTAGHASIVSLVLGVTGAALVVVGQMALGDASGRPAAPVSVGLFADDGAVAAATDAEDVRDVLDRYHL